MIFLSQHYKFFQNNLCEFFPCHKTNDLDNFNCLFCFCPAYALGNKCGGNLKYKGDIKDCSNCLFPHSKNGYAFIISKMGDVMELGKKK